jgi:peptidoglycan/xylan/chitin deacetylase (PgdA/CDA1 family)
MTAIGHAPTERAIPVLLYHSVADRGETAGSRYTVGTSKFAEHIRAVRGIGGTPLTISELGAVLRGRRPLPERAYAITFDDGFADTPRAVEILAERGISSTVFVETGRLEGPRPSLPAEAFRDLLELYTNELGAHTVSHPRLDELPIARASWEIRASKAALEDAAQRSIRCFAYPHGAYDRGVRAAVAEAGFGAAAAVKNALSHGADDPLAIARWTVTRDTDAETITRLLAGGGAPWAWEHERMRTRAYRRARRLRRALTAGTGGAR